VRKYLDPGLPRETMNKFGRGMVGLVIVLGEVEGEGSRSGMNREKESELMKVRVLFFEIFEKEKKNNDVTSEIKIVR